MTVPYNNIYLNTTNQTSIVSSLLVFEVSVEGIYLRMIHSRAEKKNVSVHLSFNLSRQSESLIVAES